MLVKNIVILSMEHLAQILVRIEAKDHIVKTKVVVVFMVLVLQVLKVSAIFWVGFSSIFLACCDKTYSGLPDEIACTDISAEQCKQENGIFYGVNSTCNDVTCCGPGDGGPDDREPGACCHYVDDVLECVDGITVQICSDEYSGTFTRNGICYENGGTVLCVENESGECDSCPGNTWQGGQSTDESRYKPGRYYEELWLFHVTSLLNYTTTSIRSRLSRRG